MSDQQIKRHLNAMEAAEQKATQSKEAAVKFLRETGLLKFTSPATGKTAKKKG